VPRQPRVDASGAIQHVTARGVAGSNVVADDDDRSMFVKRLAQSAERYGWGIHAYCLMDTHLHLVVETPEPSLGMGMQRLLGGYASWFNRRHGRYGHLFAGRFVAWVVDSEAYAIDVCAYVVLNPVRAGMVRAPEDWKWSSYRATAGLVRPPSFLETRLVPAMLHPDRKRAQEIYRELVHEIASRPRAGQAKA
jgi:putative transposase